jgi:hypothetical protein
MDGYRTIAVSLLLGVSFLVCGCKRGTSLDRLPIHGTVTIGSGAKLNKGSITFQPAPGQRGPSASASVSDGVYAFNRENGPTAGSQVVMISRIESRRFPSKNATKPVPGEKSQWEQNKELADDGVYVHNFTLKN